MLDPLWAAVDRSLCTWLVGDDPLLDEVLRSADAAGLPAIHVAPNQGKLLHLLARATGARRVLEIGTLAGYSSIWLARALPAGGQLVTLELEPARAAIARRNLERAALAATVRVIEGPALASLDALIHDGEPAFDLTFIDADKLHCAEYLDRSIALSRPGSLIIVDNVVRGGRVIEADTDDASVNGVRRMMLAIERHPALTATAIQTVGAKGYDGFVLAVVTGRA